MLLNKIKLNMKSKEGSEILQSLMIIAIVGAVAVTMAMTFKNQLYNSLGDKIDDSTYDYSEMDSTGNVGQSLILSGMYNNKNKITYNR